MSAPADTEVAAQLTAWLRDHGRGVTTAIVDRQALAHNAAALRATWPRGHALRLAVKSLGCIEVLRDLWAQLGDLAPSAAPRFMTFHPDHVAAVLEAFPNAHVMAGKPMLLAALRRCIAAVVALDVRHLERVQFLLDGEQALHDLANVASEYGVEVNACVELDIGLGRGGIATPAALRGWLDLATRAPRVTLGGAMGYDGHVGRLPPLLQSAATARLRAHERYRALYGELKRAAPDRDLVCNAAGSLSYHLYAEDGAEGVVNDLTVGSALIKPASFDHPHLAAFKPAIYLGVPVLKVLREFAPPGPALLGKALRHWPLGRRLSAFVDGGDYLADPHYPPGLALDPFLGHSRNQALYCTTHRTPTHVAIHRGDYLLLRPRDSEYAWEAFADALLWQGDLAEPRYVPTLRS